MAPAYYNFHGSTKLLFDTWVLPTISVLVSDCYLGHNHMLINIEAHVTVSVLVFNSTISLLYQ